MPVFVDTNVLVYARDAREPAKQERAAAWMEHLWSAGTGRVSVQVLAEFYVTVTRKLDPGMDPEAARADVEDLLAWHPVHMDEGLLLAACSLEGRYRLSFWDALVLAAAQVAGCEILLTEDLRHGARYDGVRVVDPFLTPVGRIGPLA